MYGISFLGPVRTQHSSTSLCLSFLVNEMKESPDQVAQMLYKCGCEKASRTQLNQRLQGLKPWVGTKPDPRSGKGMDFPPHWGLEANLGGSPGPGKPQARRFGLSKYLVHLLRARCHMGVGHRGEQSVSIWDDSSSGGLARRVSLSPNI